MPTQAIVSWLAKHSNAPTTALKPIASRLGVPTNYLGAALFAGQLVYENQDAIVEYASKGGVTVGEFLHARARERYGEDHPLTRHLGENVDAISEAFEGTEEEARTFAEFYRRYRTVDREHRLRDELDPEAVRPDPGVVEALTKRLPSTNRFPSMDRLPGRDVMPGRDAVPDLPELFASDHDSDDESVDIPVVDQR